MTGEHNGIAHWTTIRLQPAIRREIQSSLTTGNYFYPARASSSFLFASNSASLKIPAVLSSSSFANDV